MKNKIEIAVPEGVEFTPYRKYYREILDEC